MRPRPSQPPRFRRQTEDVDSDLLLSQLKQLQAAAKAPNPNIVSHQVLSKNQSSFEYPGIPLFSHCRTVQPRQSEIPDNAKISVCTHWVDTNHLHCFRKTELRLNPIPRGLAMCNRQVTVGLNFFYCFQLCHYFQKENLLLK